MPLNDKSLDTRDMTTTVTYEPYSKFKPYSRYCYKGLFIDGDTSRCFVFINQVVYEDGEVWKSDIIDSKWIIMRTVYTPIPYCPNYGR